MAATPLTATTLTHTTAVTVAASPGATSDPTNGNSFPNGGESILVMNNTAGASATASIAITKTVDGQAVTARQFTVPATTIQYVKLGPVDTYGTTVTVTTSAATLKLAVYAV